MGVGVQVNVFVAKRGSRMVDLTGQYELLCASKAGRVYQHEAQCGLHKVNNMYEDSNAKRLPECTNLLQTSGVLCV